MKYVAKQRVLKPDNAVRLIILASLIVWLAFKTGGLTISAANIVNILLQSSIRGVAAIGQAAVMLTAGVDLSIGGIGLLSSLLGGLLMTDSWLNIIGHPFPALLAIPIMLLVGTGLGTINGVLVSRVMMPALIVTLGMWEILKGLGYQISGGYSIANLPENLSFLGSGTVASIPVPFIVFMVVAVAAHFVLRRSRLGGSIYSVGANPVSTWLSGVKVKNVILFVYSVSGFLAALAGVIMTARTMTTSMRTLAGLEMDSIACVITGGVSLAGGRGTVLGVVVGVFIISVIENAMSVLGASPAVPGIVRGIIIISAVAFEYVRRQRARIA